MLTVPQESASRWMDRSCGCRSLVGLYLSSWLTYQTNHYHSYYCVDGALPKDSLLATSGDLWDRSAEKICKSMDTIFKTKARVEAAFTNITAVWYKIRFQSMIGPRAYFSRRLEDSRRRKCWRLGGVFDVCSDTHGAPGPWTPEEAHVWVAKMRKEICNPAYHAYCLKRRVYAQKPLDG